MVFENIKYIDLIKKTETNKMSEMEQIQKEMDNIGKYNFKVPDIREVRSIVIDILALMFPGFFRGGEQQDLEILAKRLSRQIKMACIFSYNGEKCLTPEKAADQFIYKLPEVKRVLLTDLEALYEGDPAAKNREEIILCYPGFRAIAVYRLAHVLYNLNIPIIPRMMTEYAHEKTGVDIHPGAQIGESFFIDHATGIVIGETTVIGSHVKLYQGVTLGAKSFEIDADGNPVKNIKRHPNIGNHVVIYANATILGGNTYIGDNSIIGASTWIVESVPKGSRVLYSPDTSKAEEFWGDHGSGI